MSKDLDMSPPLTRVERREPASILVADPDLAAARAASSFLRERGFRSTACHGGAALDRALLGPDHDVIVCEIALLGARAGHASRPADGPGLILTSAFGSVEDEVRALRDGALACLSKPVDLEQLLLSVTRAIETRALARENVRLKADLEEKHRLGSLLTRDPETRRVLEIAGSLAPTRATILIEGESGTGKTLLARAIHQASGGGPFVEVSCGALPSTLLESELFGHARGAFTGATRDRAGKFEAADGGTLFLDEIGAAPLELQQKLLRVLQDKTFERLGEVRTRTADVRVVAATNEDLEAAVAKGRFREDLYWRIRVVALRLPPLRERREDVALLAAHFLERFRAEHRRPITEIAPDALALLTSSPWPGNVRELEHCIERAVLLAPGPRIQVGDLGLRTPPGTASRAAGGGPPSSPDDLVSSLRSLFGANRPFTLREALAIPEREILRLALELQGGHRQATARMLGVNRSTLFNKMRRYGLLGHPRRAKSGGAGAGEDSGPAGAG
jgi:DNA-binding NtrC family response regulator